MSREIVSMAMSLPWRCFRRMFRGQGKADNIPTILFLTFLCFSSSLAKQIPVESVRSHVDNNGRSPRPSSAQNTAQVSRPTARHKNGNGASHLTKDGVVSRPEHLGRVAKNLEEKVDTVTDLDVHSARFNPFSPTPPSARSSGGRRRTKRARVDSSTNTSLSENSLNSTQSHGNESGELSVDSILCEYYSPWSTWRPCNRKCEQSRMRRCQKPEHCGQTWLKEVRTCKRKRGACSSFSYRTVGFRRRNRLIERVLYDVLYSDWSDWGPCTRSCRQRRRRKCTVRDVCHNSFIQEMRRCTIPGSRCQRRYSLKPSNNVDQDDDDRDQHITDTSAGDSGAKGQTDSKPTRKRKKKRKSKDTKERQGTTKAESVDMDGVQETCGVRPPGGSYRVVGGQEAKRLSWPWQVAILTRWEEQYCAGTLVAPQWVLTAAHCIRKRNRRRRLVVRTGEHDLQVFEGSEDDIRPDKDFPHPDFDYATITNDIGLIHLRQPVKARSQVRYACLPESPDFQPDRDALCYILGWGKRRNAHLFGSDTLHQAQVPLVEHKRCQKVFDYHINTTQVCAGYKKGGIDSCAGDSGGPLLCPRTENGETRWYVTGITSYGEGCGRKGKYGIYTRVASYLNWIRDTIDSF